MEAPPAELPKERTGSSASLNVKFSPSALPCCPVTSFSPEPMILSVGNVQAALGDAADNESIHAGNDIDGEVICLQAIDNPDHRLAEAFAPLYVAAAEAE
jgi:hypothetical protein